jgi:hypothetical protein
LEYRRELDAVPLREVVFRSQRLIAGKRKPEPWSTLVPDLVIIEIATPPVRRAELARRELELFGR